MCTPARVEAFDQYTAQLSGGSAGGVRSSSSSRAQGGHVASMRARGGAVVARGGGAAVRPCSAHDGWRRRHALESCVSMSEWFIRLRWQLQEKNENVVRCTATCGVNTTNNVAPLLCLYGTVVTGGGAVVTGACPPSSLVTSARHSQVASRGSQPVPPPKSTRTPWLVCEREVTNGRDC